MKAFTLLLFLSIGSIVFGQTVVKATSQSWAGGVCCRTGTNFSVSIQVENGCKSIGLKEIWLKGEGLLTGIIYPLAPIEKNGQVNITFRVSYDSNNYEIIRESIENRDEGMPEFEGDALILMIMDNKEYQIIVKEFESLPYLAYP